MNMNIRLMAACLGASCAFILSPVHAEDVAKTKVVAKTNVACTNMLLSDRLYVGDVDPATPVALDMASHPPEFVKDGALLVKTWLDYYSALIREDFEGCESYLSAPAKQLDYCGDRNTLNTDPQYLNKKERKSGAATVPRRILQIRVPTVHFKRDEVVLILQYVMSDKSDGSNAWIISGADRWVREKNKKGEFEWTVCPLTQSVVHPPF